MSKVCQVTGKRPTAGNNVSFSHRKTKRRFEPNLQTKRYYIPSEGRWVKLTLSTKGMKTISKRGIESVIADMRRNGVKV
ncbi:MAG: 50S ribosomal protein L28 [Euzebya sp.]